MIKKPFAGALILVLFIFFFLIIYRPLSIHKSLSFNLGTTVALYCLLLYFPAALTGKILKMTSFFSEKKEWTLFKDVLSVLIIVSALGIAGYLAGFIMEESNPRLNLSTFINSFRIVVLVCIVPFFLPMMFNFRYLLLADTVRNFTGDIAENNPAPEPVRIISKLKKEDISFFPDQLIYAESEGNYVNFYLAAGDKTLKKTVRNSIYEIEDQLSSFSFIFRTHRAFLVNLHKISSATGNSLGYRLKLTGTDTDIPVSRNRVEEFNSEIRKLH